jgi:Polysaccharide pyruvyl transferase
MAWFAAKPLPKEYHWNEVPNFGDAMAPLLLKRFADLDTERDTVSHARIVTIGSVLEHVPPEWDGIVLGSGKLLEGSQLGLHTKTATILALRGPLTARQCPAGNYAIGDPGLLVSELVPAQPKLYDLGIVPHWSDTQLASRPEFSPGAGDKWTAKVISPRGDPVSVITEIARCHRVVTSSLHGAVTADAFGIPRRVEPAGVQWTKDKLFKWRDYSASISTAFEPGRMTEVRRLLVADRQYELFDAYLALGDMVRKGGRW